MINKKIYLFFMVFTSLFLFSALEAATVYKWIDEDGQVHYGSRAQSKAAKKLKIKKHKIDVDEIDTLVDKDKKLILEKEKKEQQELNIIRCNASKAQLKRYENSGALYDLDEKGNRILLHKKQYEKAMTQAKARVKKWCN